MWPVTDQYLDVIAGPHQIRIEADVLIGTTVAYRGLPVTAGRVTVSSRQRVRRSCDLTITPTLPISTYATIPALAASATTLDAGHPLAWTGPEIRLRHGLVYPSQQVEWVPVGVFRIDSNLGSLMQDSPVQVTGSSRESWLIDDNRRQGAFVTAGGMATQLIKAAILATAPGAEILISTRSDRLVPASSADDSDPWATVERLARSIGAVAYCDGAGRFIITDQPNKDSAPVTLLRGGPGGTLVSANGGGSRTDVATGVSVTGATPTGAASPLVAVAYNDDPTSPTRRGDPSAGLFGYAMRYITDSSLTTLVDCQRVAAAELARGTGVASQLDLQSVPMPYLEALDVIDVATDHTRVVQSLSRHVTDGYTLDLAAGAGFPVQTRDLGEAAA